MGRLPRMLCVMERSLPNEAAPTCIFGFFPVLKKKIPRHTQSLGAAALSAVNPTRHVSH